MTDKKFKPGDVIKLKDKEYIVIQNYGLNGLVKEICENGAIIKGFSWVQGSEQSKFIRTEDVDNETINSVKKEYIEFFEKYEI